MNDTLDTTLNQTVVMKSDFDTIMVKRSEYENLKKANADMKLKLKNIEKMCKFE